MSVYLSTKFQISSVILTSFRQEVILPIRRCLTFGVKVKGEIKKYVQDFFVFSFFACLFFCFLFLFFGEFLCVFIACTLYLVHLTPFQSFDPCLITILDVHLPQTCLWRSVIEKRQIYEIANSMWKLFCKNARRFDKNVKWGTAFRCCCF